MNVLTESSTRKRPSDPSPPLELGFDVLIMFVSVVLQQLSIGSCLLALGLSMPLRMRPRSRPPKAHCRLSLRRLPRRPFIPAPRINRHSDLARGDECTDPQVTLKHQTREVGPKFSSRGAIRMTHCAIDGQISWTTTPIESRSEFDGRRKTGGSPALFMPRSRRFEGRAFMMSVRSRRRGLAQNPPAAAHPLRRLETGFIPPPGLGAGGYAKVRRFSWDIALLRSPLVIRALFHLSRV